MKEKKSAFYRIVVMIAMIFCMMLALTACSHSQQASETKGETTWQEQYDLGMKYLSESKYEEAIIAFTLAIDIDPKQTPAYMGRGDAYAANIKMKRPAKGEAWSAELTGMYENAEADYLEVISRDAKLAAPYEKLADLYLMGGDREKAIEILQKGYEATGDEMLLERSKALLDMPDMDEALLKNALIVTMYDMEEDFCGHDAYSYDEKGRMISNIWYNDENGVEYSESWIYDDEAGKTTSTIYEAEYDDYDDGGEYGVEAGEEGDEAGEAGNQQPEDEHKSGTKTIDGCEDQGWYWESMDEFLTDPTMDVVDGRVPLEDGRYGIYKYDSAGRVVLIHTYDESNSLLGYCVVTYYGDN